MLHNQHSKSFFVLYIKILNLIMSVIMTCTALLKVTWMHIHSFLDFNLPEISKHKKNSWLSKFSKLYFIKKC